MLHRNFKLLNKKVVFEQNCEIFEYEHIKTGANIYHIKTDDKNKVFSIGFKTLVDNSKGIPHILEHSVLCGSEKYNIKKPFVELMKGSLATFINALTYRDLTVYPISSQNDEDFIDLMNIYLDAVLAPNAIKDEEIFMQEGWHYELNEDRLVRNGVVYNEMKGVYSNPYSILEYKTSELLYTNGYKYVSGGNPDVIPELTYDEFISYYEKYYHPSNSCVVLIGDIDLDVIFPIINGYFSKYNKINVIKEINKTIPLEKPIEAIDTYNITEHESEENKTFLNISYMIDESTNKTKGLAFKVLSSVLFNSQASYIKNTLLSQRLCGNIYANYDDYKSQSNFTITVCNINPEDKNKIIKIIDDSLNYIVKNGIDESILNSIINSSEFNIKEIKDSYMPYNINRAISLIKSWNYDKVSAINSLDYKESFEIVRQWIKEEKFTSLIKDYLINNNQKVTLLLKPEKNKAIKDNENDIKRLEQYKQNLSKQQLDELINKTNKLKERQIKGDSKEELECMPRLGLKDINKEARCFNVIDEVVNGIRTLSYIKDTNSITYSKLKFDISCLDKEEIQYANLLCSLLRLINTEKYSFQDLDIMSMTYTGGLDFSISAVDDFENSDKTSRYLDVSFKFLNKNLKVTIELLEQIIFSTKFDDVNRIYQIIMIFKNRLNMSIVSDGHKTVFNRLNSMFSNQGIVSEIVGGVSCLEFINNIIDIYHNNSDEIIDNIKKVYKKIFIKNDVILTVIGQKNDRDMLVNSIKNIVEKLPTVEERNIVKLSLLPQHKEAFKSNSNVQYVGQAISYKKYDYKFTGPLLVTTTILKTDYLWNTIRVLGGAYGAMCQVSPTGTIVLVSYRDPQLTKTLEAYKGLANYIRNLVVDETLLTKYIIGTIKDLDHPMLPEQEGNVAITNYLSNYSNEMRQQIRDEVLSTTKEDILNFVELLDKINEDRVISIIGNSNNIANKAKIFDVVYDI